MLDDERTDEFALPFRMNRLGTEPEVVQQDSDDEIRSCVEVLIRTPVGFHEEAPELGGRPDPFDEGQVDMDEIHSAIAQFEPRADALLSHSTDWLDDLVQNLNIEARVSDDGR
jgi:hypothetical protein